MLENHKSLINVIKGVSIEKKNNTMPSSLDANGGEGSDGSVFCFVKRHDNFMIDIQ